MPFLPIVFSFVFQEQERPLPLPFDGMTGVAAKRSFVCGFVCCLICSVLSEGKTEVNLPTGIVVPSCRRHWIVHRIDLAHCTQQRILSRACKGQCESYTQYSTDTNDIERVCSCCQPHGRKLRRIRMRCRNPKTFMPEVHFVQVYIPNSCMCRPCSVSIDNVPDVVNPLEAVSDNPAMDFLLLRHK